MAVFEIFAQPELRRYKTHACSKAVVFQIFVILLTYIPPLLVAYRSRGFWRKTDNYREQIQGRFEHQMLLVLDTGVNGEYVTWSTYQNYNQMQQAHLRVPLIKSREVDVNGDGNRDLLEMNVEVPLKDTEKVYGVKLMLFFFVHLSTYSQIDIKSMGLINYDASRPGAELRYIGDLKFKQKEPVMVRGTDRRYDGAILSNSIHAEAYDFYRIIRDYQKRNLTANLENAYPLWVTGRAAGQPFVINATINYVDSIVEYHPGLWQLLKWAWIQYLAIMIIFWWVFRRIKLVVFENKLVNTVVERPWNDKKHPF
ncbi:transmembrane protein 231-like [Lineus longissimus]|uniref:transmembrane protein 231-like n=1 Tax=Lineus longissimus TaxID=88925 RepID=UPI002B4E6ED9